MELQGKYGDKVFILGDISYRGKNENLISYISTLKGQKILIKGNHDDVSDYRYHQLFADMCDYKEIHDSVKGKNYDLVLCQCESCNRTHSNAEN